MSLLKVHRGTDGVKEIRIPIRFTDIVQNSLMEPWGTQWYVDSIDGNDDYTGRGPSVAKATIQAAVSAAGRGDTIYIRPGIWNTGTGFDRYDEAVVLESGVDGTDMLKSNISMIGVSSGGTGDFLGVRWKETSTVAFTNYAPAFHMENIGFFSEGATQGVLCVNDGVTLSKQGTQGTSFYNCAFKGKGLYVTGGGDGFTVEKTRFQCSYTGVVAALNYSASSNPGRRLTVRDCEWLDGNGNVPNGTDIVIAPPLTEMLIRDCYFGQPPSPGNNVYIATAGAVEGLIANCFFNTSNLDTNANITLGDAVLAVACYDEAGLAFTS